MHRRRRSYYLPQRSVHNIGASGNGQSFGADTVPKTLPPITSTTTQWFSDVRVPAVVIRGKNLTDEVLIEKVRELIENPRKLDALARRAAETYVSNTPDRIYAVVDRLANKSCSEK